MTEAYKNSTESFVQYDATMQKIYVQGTTVPADAVAGYQKGCLFVDLDVAAGTSGLYVNIGTSTACNFNLVTNAADA